jgi:tetratricopeptide (TPR) repeat protein
MARAARRGWSPARFIKTITLAIAGLALAWLIVTVSAPRALPMHIATRVGLDNRYPALLFRLAGQELLANRGRLSPETYALLMEAAGKEPLAADPYMFFGLRALESGDIAGAERLLAEARARNPRLHLARLALIGIYLRLNRVPQATSEIASMVRILPRSSGLLVPELARLALGPETRGALVEALGADPLMGQVLSHLIQEGTDPALVLQLAARQPRSQNGQFAPWQTALINAYVNRGDAARGHALWREFLGAAPSGELVYDAGFRGRPGGDPFNWRLVSDSAGAAEMTQGALEVTFYGRNAGTPAAQLLVLKPGNYRLRFRVEGSANAKGSRLQWQVKCHPGEAALLTLPLENVTYTPRAVDGQFTVPAGGCSAQMLQLMGLPGEFPETQTVRISEFAVEPAGARP